MDFLSLADQFRAAAIVLDDGTDDHRDALFEVLRTCALSLSSSEEGRAEFAELMHDESPWVSSWAATHLLSLGDESAISVLSKLSDQSGLSGFAAGVVLREYAAGRLRSPFGEV